MIHSQFLSGSSPRSNSKGVRYRIHAQPPLPSLLEIKYRIAALVNGRAQLRSTLSKPGIQPDLPGMQWRTKILSGSSGAALRIAL
jgi:hypothetical protein